MRETDQALSNYIAQVKQIPALSREEEHELALRWRDHQDRAAGERLVRANLRYVVAIALTYRRYGLRVSELIAEGNVGVVTALRKFDPDKGTRFVTYAAYWIRAFILRFLMTNARLIHVGNTRAGRKLFFRLEKERQKLLAAGFDPTPKLLAAKLDVDEKDVEEVSAHLASREVSIEPRPDDEGGALTERISGGGASPESEAARSEISENIGVLMKRFEESLKDDRERAVWREHLAAPEEAVPLGELGARFGVTKQRMGQIADKVKKRFRELVLSELGTEIQLAWQPGTDD